MLLISRQLLAGGETGGEEGSAKGASGEDRGEGPPGSRGQFSGLEVSGLGYWAPGSGDKGVGS